MNIEKYSIFLQVVESGSITTAAHRLGYTQSGVSHVVSSLEEEFGFPLLVRRKSGVELTDEARRLLPEMREVVLSDARLHQLVNAISGVTTGFIRVGTFSSVAVQWMPSLIKMFKQSYPLVDFQLFNGTYAQLVGQISGKQLDCAFTSQAAQGENAFTPLYRDSLVLILPQGHPLAKHERLPLSALQNEHLIIPGEGIDYDVGKLLRDAGLLKNVRYALYDDYAALAMVENGLGCCILPTLLLKNQGQHCAIVPLDPPQTRTIGLLFPSGVHQSPACRAFVQVTKEWINRAYRSCIDEMR